MAIIKSNEQKSREAQQMLRAMDQQYRAKLKAVHDEYNRQYDFHLKKHGIVMTSNIQQHFSHPLEFHADMAPHKAKFLAACATIQSERGNAVRQKVRVRGTAQFVKAN